MPSFVDFARRIRVLDAFWDPKPYVTTEEYRRFCGPTTLLARLEARTFAHGDTLSANIEISHFGPVGLPGATVSWILSTDADTKLGSGRFGPVTVPTGELSPVGTATLSFEATEATRATLHVSVDDIRELFRDPAEIRDEPGD